MTEHYSGEWGTAALSVQTEACRGQLAENERLKAEVERLQLARWEPLGDNHHNAEACPYCSADRVAERARTTEMIRFLKVERDAALAEVERLHGDAMCRGQGRAHVPSAESRVCGYCKAAVIFDGKNWVTPTPPPTEPPSMEPPPDNSWVTFGPIGEPGSARAAVPTEETP